MAKTFLSSNNVQGVRRAEEAMLLLISSGSLQRCKESSSAIQFFVCPERGGGVKVVGRAIKNARNLVIKFLRQEFVVY